MALRAGCTALSTYDPQDRLPSLEFTGRSLESRLSSDSCSDSNLAQIPYRPHPRIPSRGRTKPRAAARTEPRPTSRFSTNPEENSRSEKQKSVAIGESNISLADCLGGDGNGRRFLLPNRSKPIFSAFLNCLGCSLKKTLLTQKTAAKLVSVVLSDSLLTQIQNCFVMSHG
jgi:hypothetical protein